MKFAVFLIISFLSYSLFADELKVEINPRRPVAGEVFQAYFRIFTTDSEMPNINFSPENLEVVGKSNQGISTRTIYANGKLTVTRELTIVYDLVAAKAGVSGLRNINVQLSQGIIRHPTLTIEIFREPQEILEVFIQADVPKKSLFLGEGVVVRYYLYSKVPVSNLDIKKYPKLNHFLKRFLQEPEQTERVLVDGQTFMRTQIYAAKLFPEKVGELKIDSLKMTASYASARANDPFSAFGINQTMRNKTMTSEVVKIDVLPLPEPVPTDFTGLVGQHEFQLQTNQTKLIVNEPLELKLTVTGNGALENVDSPVLLKHPGLEEFESNGDLKIIDAYKATKVFDYTFLAKENLKLPASTVVLSYLDPDKGKYIPVELSLPEISVAGGEAIPGLKKEEVSKNVEKNSGFQKISEQVKDFSGLNLNDDHLEWRIIIHSINSVLVIIAFFLVLGWLVRFKGFNIIQFKNNIPPTFKKGHFDFRVFLDWLGPLIMETGKSPVAIIKDSPLSDDSKSYFIDLLTLNDYKEYSLRKSQAEFKYQAKYFKELSQYIESFSNVSPSQPS
jgi:hypothetical protein